MRILPVTNKTTPTKPAFQARIPKSIVKQMLGKTETLTNLDIRTTAGVVFSVPAAAASKLYAGTTDEQVETANIPNDVKVDKLPTIEELDKLSGVEIVNVAKLQDKDDRTIFHRYFDWKHLDKFSNNAYADDKNYVFSLKDYAGRTAYQANPQEHLKNSIIDTAINGELSAKDAVELLEVNEISPYLRTFLKARIDKDKDNAVSHVPVSLRDEIEKAEALDDKTIEVQTKSAIYPKLSLEDAAKIFVEDDDSGMLDLDVGYLNNSDESMHALLNSAYSTDDTTCLDEICSILDLTKIVENTEPVKPELAHLETLSSYLTKDDLQALFDKTEADGYGIVHYMAEKMDVESIDGFLRLLDSKLDEDTVKTILSMRIDNGQIPMHRSDNARSVILNYYYDSPDFIAEQLKSQDAEGNTPLHMTIDPDIIRHAFEVLKNEPAQLAEILMIEDNEGDTIYRASISDYESSDTKLIRDKIIELATDSDLSVEDSIKLLKANVNEPQLVEYLKLQQTNNY